MYAMRASAGVRKQLKTLFKKISPQVKDKFFTQVKENPHSRRSQGSELLKIERKGPIYCYEITGGDRILFDVLESEKVVIVLFAGNHDAEERYLKSLAKK